MRFFICVGQATVASAAAVSVFALAAAPAAQAATEILQLAEVCSEWLQAPTPRGAG